MTFSVETFRKILEARVSGEDKTVGMINHSRVYWEFYANKDSPVYTLNERRLLLLTDAEIFQLYAQYLMEKDL